MPSGLRRTMGISAAPGYLVFFSSAHVGRVTPALEHMMMLGPPRGEALPLKAALIAFIAKISTDCLGVNFSLKAPISLLRRDESCESEKPVAHQTAAAASLHASCSCVAESRSHCTISRAGFDVSRFSSAFLRSLTRARTWIGQ
jgi:hypothetical protein